MRPEPGVRLTVVLDRPVAVYSGMVPGFVAGQYRRRRARDRRAAPRAPRGGPLHQRARGGPGSPRSASSSSRAARPCATTPPSSTWARRWPGSTPPASAPMPFPPGPSAASWARSTRSSPPPRRAGAAVSIVVGAGAGGVELAFALSRAARARGRARRSRSRCSRAATACCPAIPRAPRAAWRKMPAAAASRSAWARRWRR